MQEMTRVLCVWIPRFGLALYCREDPHLLLEPTALAEGEGESALLCEVSRKAAKAGVAIGMTAAQAGTLCAGLVVKVKSSHHEDNNSREIVQILQRIAPFVEVAAPGRYFIEASGFDKLYGGEQALAERVIAAIRDFDLSAQIGCAENAFVARVACEQTRAGTHQRVDSSRAREFLEPLPVKYLAVAEEIKEQLVALGLRTIGQVAAFPTNELTERFGAEGRLLAHLARGKDPKRFDPLKPEEDITERLTLDYPLFSTMAVSARVEKLLAAALDKLAMREMGASRMLLRLQFDNRTHKELELAVDRPTLSVRKFLRQLQGEWERLTFPAAVIELALTPLAIAPMETKQMELSSRQVHTAASALLQKTEMLFRVELRKSILPEESFELVAAVAGHNPVVANTTQSGARRPRPYGDAGQALVGLDRLSRSESPVREQRVSRSIFPRGSDGCTQGRAPQERDLRQTAPLRRNDRVGGHDTTHPVSCPPDFGHEPPLSRGELIPASGHNLVLADARPGSRPDATQSRVYPARAGSSTDRTLTRGSTKVEPTGIAGQALVGHDEINNHAVHENTRHLQDDLGNWLPSASLVGLRLVNPTQAIEVICERESLCAVIINRRRQVVCRQHGPWLICGRWWEEQISREYYEIEAAGGETYLIFRTGGETNWRWYLQGMFD